MLLEMIFNTLIEQLVYTKILYYDFLLTVMKIHSTFQLEINDKLKETSSNELDSTLVHWTESHIVGC